MSKLNFLIFFCASFLFATVVGLRKFLNLNNPANLFKDHSSLVRSRAFDDGSCDKQLAMFSDAFSSREAWAFQCKNSESQKATAYFQVNLPL